MIGLGVRVWWLALVLLVGAWSGHSWLAVAWLLLTVVGFGSLRHWLRVSAPHPSALALGYRRSRHALMFLQRPELPQPHAFRRSSELLRQKGLVYEPNLPQ